ncbi:MAG: ComEC/Rec2 family competence protein [Mycobacteriales bacterium]
MSGANVAIILGAALVLARWLRLGPRAGPALAALALAGFVVLARPSPSVLRAAGMGLVVVLALATGRGRGALPALSAAVLGLLLVEPALSRSVGFALSVAATAGLLVLAPPWRERLARRLPGWLADAIAVPLAAQCACAPLIAAVSAQVSLVAVPANLLAAPAVVPATLFGVLTALVAPWCMPLGRILARLAGVPTAAIIAVAHTGARLPGAALSWPGGATGAAMLAVASVIIGVLFAFGFGRRLLATVVVSGLLAVAGVRAVMPGWPPAGWQLVACDVGQGDALVLSAGRGTALVVDAGPDPTLVDRCLRTLRVRSVPLVVLTHLHADHVEGLPAVLRGHGVREVEIGPLGEPTAERDRVAGWVRRSGARLTRVVDGEQRSLGPLRWRVLAPARPFIGTNSDPNNSSIVLRVELAGFTALLTGDVEPPAQKALLDSRADLRADVLKVPHHGSDHQEPAFLDAAAASLAITSVGAGNTYGHPSARTLQRLSTDGARSYRTDRDGAVALLRRDGALVATARRGSGTPPAGPSHSGSQASGSAPANARVGGRSSAGLRTDVNSPPKVRLGTPSGGVTPGQVRGLTWVVFSTAPKRSTSAAGRPLPGIDLAVGPQAHGTAAPAARGPPVQDWTSCQIRPRR